MSRKLALFLALMLSGVSIGSLAQPANAQTPLTRAVIQALRNRVRLMQKNRPVRSAQVSDAIAPGDALSTARASLAELRFNDGSLARVGEQAVFRFVPNARTFQLSNGTMLLLIPPGRGPTGVRTPNAAAGIKGSALFVRYIPETDTTLVGALTNNPQGPMVIYNRDGSQSQGLRAGQLAVVVKNRIENIYDFDLNTFYETSDLVKGLNLTQKDSTTPSDEAIAAVRAETVEALQDQSPFKEANVVENPAFVRLPSDSADFPVNNLDRVFNPLDVRRVVEAGEVQSEQTPASSQENESSAGGMPVTGVTPPATQPASGPATAAQGQPPSQAPSGPTVSPLSPPAPAASTPTAPVVPAPTSNPSQPTVPATPVVPPAAQEPGRPPVPAPQVPVVPVVTQPTVPATPVVPPAAQEPGRPPVPAPQVPVVPVITQPTVPATPVVPPAAQEPGRPPAPAPQVPVVPVITQPTVPATPVVPPAAQEPGRPPAPAPAPQPPTQNPGPPIMIEPLPGGSVVPIDLSLPPIPPTTPGPSNPPGPPVSPTPPVDVPPTPVDVPPTPPVDVPPTPPVDVPPTPPVDVPPTPVDVPPTPPVDAPPTPPVDAPSVTDQPPNGGPATGGGFPGGGATGGNFPGGGATGGNFPGRANGGNFPGRAPLNR
uniref:FecR domain-containing protein n=1 Tax=Trichocoleus desertorum TaxID=1481672 RepID=UPI0025B4F533|nr:FecR domain-containing protein [Trichocoleus desertorum]